MEIRETGPRVLQTTASKGQGEVSIDGRTPATADKFEKAASPKSYDVQEIGILKIPNAGFLSLGSTRPGAPLSLVISSFNAMPCSGDNVYSIPDVGKHLDNLSRVTPESLTDRIVWPNEVGFLPQGSLGTEGLIVPSGFIMPWKNNGKIDILPLLDGKPGDPVTVTPEHPGWFYHRAIPAEVDGKEGILTARGRKPIPFGAEEGELVFLERPPAGAPQGPWTEHVIAKGPDSNLRYVDIDGDGQKEILATEFFGKKLEVFWQGQDGAWKGQTIDDKIGSAFDVQVADLNRDGRLELVATNHEDKSDKSAVFAYEIPKNFKEGEGEWVRHTLATGFKTPFSFSPSGSPGAAIPFSPDSNATAEKPFLLVSGDGSQQGYVLTPRSADPTDWNYNCQTILQGGCTVGNGAVGDVDNDGNPELFVPCYEKGEVHVFRLRESQ